jgi:hypothetical protein
MKWYVSAKWEQHELVKRLQDIITRHGHTITEDWTARAFSRDYAQYRDSGAHAETEVKAIRQADAVLHLSDGGGKGKYADIGAACMAYDFQGKPKVYVIGEKADESQFYFHPAVTRIMATDIETAVKKILDE